MTDLTTRLAALADRAPAEPLDLAAVQRRARARRLRGRVVIVGSIVALTALAVPVALTIGDAPGLRDTVAVQGQPSLPPATPTTPVAVDDGAAADGPDVVPYSQGTAPLAFRNRIRLTSCGTYELRQGEQVPSTARACLAQAREDGVSAELTHSAPSLEGQATVTYDRTLVDGTREVWTDSTRDDFGRQGWQRAVCADGGPRCSRLFFPTEPQFAPPCEESRASAIDVDSLQIGTESYVALPDVAPKDPMLGATLGAVQCRFADNERSSRGGAVLDASSLPAGTEIFEIARVDPGVQLAARTEDGVRLYGAR